MALFDSKDALNHAIRYLTEAAVKRNTGGWVPPKERERQQRDAMRQEQQQARQAEKQQKELMRAEEKQKREENRITANKGGKMEMSEAENNFRKWAEGSYYNKGYFNGYGAPRVWWHLTKKDPKQFQLGSDADEGIGNVLWLTDDPGFTGHSGGDRNPIPVHVNVKNPFTHRHVDKLAKRVKLTPDEYAHIADPWLDEETGSWGNYNILERPDVLKAIKDMGHDAVEMRENFTNNLMIFEPQGKVKLPFDKYPGEFGAHFDFEKNEGTYDPNHPDIRKSEGGLILSKQYPTHYMPNVGRQVMAKGGQTRDSFKYGGHKGEEMAAPTGYFEIAPGKTWDSNQQESWEALHPQAKQAISNKMIGEFLSQWQRISNIQGEVRPGLGGFGGHTNPNYSFHPYNPDHMNDALNQLGELFRQDSMMGAHARPFKGSFPAGVIRVHLPKNVSHEEAHSVYDQLSKLGLAEGHSTNPAAGTMDIISGDGKKKTIAAAKAIDKALGGKYDVSSYPTNIAFPEHGESYGISGSSTGEPSGSSTSQAYADLKAKASSRLQELLNQAHEQGGGHQGEVNFGDTLAPGQPHPDTLPALIPKSGQASRGPQPIDQPRPDIAPTSHSPENLERISTQMWKDHPASGGEVLGGQEAFNKMVDLHTKNLLALWDRTPQQQRQTSRFWYRAAHALGNTYAEDHNIEPRAAHGIMAVLSPQNPWDKNVTQAERLMDILHHHMDTPWTNGMSHVAQFGGSKGTGLPEDKGTKETGPHTWNDIEGKTLREVLSMPHGQKKAAMWIRAFDEAHNPTEYQAVSPTGEFIGTQMNKTGSAPDTASWNSYNPIQKAISIWFDSSRENINEQIGDNHKVREFYNVITNPHDPNGVVIDTHAVAAGEMLPHGSSAKAVHRNFGSTPGVPGKEYLERIGTPWVEGESPSRTTGPSGAKGDYPVHAEAVRRAAWARGVHPSEMQSVTWERARTLFSNKGPESQRKARAIWDQYARGELTHDQTIDAIINAFGGETERAASWHGAHQGATSVGNVRTGSYVRPMNITAESPAIQRYGSAETEPEDQEKMKRGGAVPHNELDPAKEYKEQTGKVHPDLKIEQPIEGTKERMSNMRADVPVRWASSPDHPSAHLAYITDEEAELLKRADLHGSNIAREHHIGPGGVPSYQGGGIGSGGSTDTSGGPGSAPGGDGSTSGSSGMGAGSGNISTGGGGGGGGGSSSTSGGGNSSSGSSNNSTSGGGGGSTPSMGIGLGSVNAFGSPANMDTFGSVDPGEEADRSMLDTLASNMRPGGNIGATFAEKAMTPDLSSGNSPLASGISSYDQNALDAINDRMRTGQAALRDASVARVAGSPPPAEFNIPNAGDLYGATNAPLAVNQQPSGMLGQPPMGATTFGTGIRQSGFPSIQTGPSANQSLEEYMGTVPPADMQQMITNQLQKTNQFNVNVKDFLDATGSPFAYSTTYGMALPRLEAKNINFAPGSKIDPTTGLPATGIATFTGDMNAKLTPEQQAAKDEFEKQFGKSFTPIMKTTYGVEERGPMVGGDLTGPQMDFGSFVPTSTQPQNQTQDTSSDVMRGTVGITPPPQSAEPRIGMPQLSQQPIQTPNAQPPMTIRQNFEQAFAAARASGAETFSWTNPATGKTGLYTTQLARKAGGRVPSLKEPDQWIAQTEKPRSTSRAVKPRKPSKVSGTAIVERALMLSSRKS